MRKWLIAGLLVLGLAALSCLPLQITAVEVTHDDCSCLCMTFQTTEPAAVDITYCKGGQCFVAWTEPTYSYLHGGGMPESIVDKIEIRAITKDGRSAYREVKP